MLLVEANKANCGFSSHLRHVSYHCSHWPVLTALGCRFKQVWVSLVRFMKCYARLKSYILSPSKLSFIMLSTYNAI